MPGKTKMRLESLGNAAFWLINAVIIVVAVAIAAMVFAIVDYLSPVLAVLLAIVVCIWVIWRGIKYFAYYF